MELLPFLLLIVVLAVTLSILFIAASRPGVRGEGYSFILVGPVPVFMKGRAAVIISLAIFLLLLLFLVGLA